MIKFRRKTIHEIADMVCGNFENDASFFEYRSSSYLTQFFEDCDMEQYVHGGSTRKWWVAGVLEEILNEPSEHPALPGPGFCTVIQVLMDRADNINEDDRRNGALSQLNATLAREGLEAFYGDDNRCYVRNSKTGIEAKPGPVTDRALSREEKERHQRLEAYIDQASEDELTENILLPLFQTLRFQRISITGHKDKAMEFGKDVWMKHRLPTGHWLYFGIQVKRGKIDSTARSKNENVAEILNQIGMMLGHEVFDPDISKKTLVDHAIIVAGGEITKQAKHWLGERLNASQRSQILFMDRVDILHLFVIHNVLMPDEPDQTDDSNRAYDLDDEIPF